MTVAIWITIIVTSGAVVLGIAYLLIDRLSAQDPRPIVGLTAAPMDGVWYLWFVTSNGTVYVRALTREGIDEPLRCLGGIWAHNSWEYSRL